MAKEKKKLEELSDEELAGLSDEDKAELLAGEPTKPESDEGDDDLKGKEGEGDDQAELPVLTDDELEGLDAGKPDDIGPAFARERKKRQKAQAELDAERDRARELEAKLQVYEDLAQGAGEAEPGTPDLDEMSIEEFAAHQRTEFKGMLDELKEEIRGGPDEGSLKRVDPTVLEPPRYVDGNGQDVSDLVDFRDGRLFELYEDPDSPGDMFPVFDMQGMLDIDAETFERIGNDERVFRAMWGTDGKPGPLAEWRANSFHEFLEALGTPDPAGAFIDKFRELTARTGRRSPVEEREVRGLGPGDSGGGGEGGSATKKLKPIMEYSDKELRDMGQDERDKFLD